MELEFATLDVFTNKRLEGNPLAVVKVPASLKDKLSQDQKQQIAKEFNLSETTFLHAPDRGKADPDALTVDIFTIEHELPFAGHPTIGTAVLAKYHLFPSVGTLNIKAGLIGLESSQDERQFIRAKIPHNVHLHSKTLADVIPKDQYESYPGLSHDVAEIREIELKAPVFSIVKGMTFALVKLPSLELLGKIGLTRLDFQNTPTPLLDPEWAPSFTSRYYYVDEGTGKDSNGEEVRNIRTRMVELGFEDPATGSAASTLAAYLTVTEKTKRANFNVVQGVEMGRRSEIHVQIAADKDATGNVKVEDLWLGGEAVIVQRGSITVD
ncbi:phenazine biosynthesis-like protein [Seiridium cupressi]